MKLHPQILNKLILLVIVTLTLISTNQIVDFQYTQYSQNPIDSPIRKANFNFTPQPISSDKMQFPQACDLFDQLQKPLQQNQTPLTNTGIDEYLNSMKQNFLKLLTLTQKLTNSQQKILHFERLINQTNPRKPQQKKLQQIQKIQNQLKDLQHNITLLNNQLKQNLSLISQKQSSSHLTESKRIELDYQIQSLKQKLRYLTNFQQQNRRALSNSQQSIDYNTYFDNLEKQFKNQSKLIEQIDIVIQKKDKLNQLKKEKANLESSILALDLYIQDIQQCNKEKQNIRDQFKNHQKINQLIYELKELKKNQEPNIYCEGVVKKLTQKITSMLRYYDIVASCASDLEPKIQELRKQKDFLQRIQEEIAYLESVTNLEDFQKIYQKQKDTIQQMYAKIKDWKMREFIHDLQKIGQLKRQTTQALQKAQNQRNALSLPLQSASTSQQTTIPGQIIILINLIKDYKLKYCGIYHRYDRLSNQYWSQIYRYESQMNLKNKLHKMYNQQRRNYEQMYETLMTIRTYIYEKI